MGWSGIGGRGLSVFKHLFVLLRGTTKGSKASEGTRSSVHQVGRAPRHPDGLVAPAQTSCVQAGKVFQHQMGCPKMRVFQVLEVWNLNEPEQVVITIKFRQMPLDVADTKLPCVADV